jgi:hypothetical protein
MYDRIYAPHTHFRNSYLHAMPCVFPLRTDDLPDIDDHLIHFTGRTGARYLEAAQSLTEACFVVFEKNRAR